MAAVEDKPCFEKLINFRDAASLLSQPAKLKPGMLYRGARPDETTPADQELLTATYRLRTILDLRSPTEHLEQAKKLAARAKAAAAAAAAADPQQPSPVLSPLSTSATATATPLPRIPGVAYREIDFNGGAYMRSLLAQLSWRAYLSVIGYYVAGYRTQAVSIIGRDVMGPRGVVGLTLDNLRVCGPEIATIFNGTLAREESYPVMVHCTQGKDRTGLVVMLVLFLLGVDERDVQRDYMASQAGLEPEREERVREIAMIGLGPEWAGCDEQLVGEVRKLLEEEYGGVGKYLDQCGVTFETQEKIKSILAA